MADLALKRIKLRNWTKFRDVELDFPEKGLVLVQGINSASGGALSSVGASKTALGEAICRVLFGVTGRFATTKQYSTDKAGDSYVKVEATFLGKPLVVEAGYQCPELSESGEGLRYSYDGNAHERGHVRQTREDLSRLIGISPLLAEWTVFVDGDNIRFNRLSQADCVDLVMAALRQPPWSDYFESVKQKSGDFRKEMAKNEADHASASERINQATTDLAAAKNDLEKATRDYSEALDSHKKQVALAEDRRRQQIDLAAGMEDKMRTIKTKLKRMEETRAKDSHALEIKIHDAEDLIEAESKKLEPIESAKDKSLAKYSEASSQHDAYKKSADKCPTCLRPMGKIDPARLQQLSEAMAAANENYAQARKKLNDATKRLTQLREECRKLRLDHEEVSASEEAKELSRQYEELDESLQGARRTAQRMADQITEMKRGVSDNAVVEAKTVVAGSQKYLTACREKLSKTAEILANDLTTQRIIDYWYQAFSPYGIPNMVLREAIGPLNHEARRLSAAMTGGTIDVHFSTTRDMANGKEKAQLNIEVDNKLGDKDLAGSSKGEAGLTNFVIAETLSEVGQISRRVGFRWFDEVLPHQDPKVCQSCYAYMKQLADKLGILIFLVDHNPVAANYADRILIVEKLKTDKVFSVARWR